MSAVANALSDLRLIDQVGLGLAAIFGLLGAFRGLWAQVIRLVTLAVAVALARALALDLSHVLAGLGLEDHPQLALAVSWLAIFAGVFILGAVLTRLGHEALKALQLSLWNRVAGALAGLVTGLGLFLLGLAIASFLASAFHGEAEGPNSFEAALEGSLTEELWREASRWIVPAMGQVQGTPQTENPPA